MTRLTLDEELFLLSRDAEKGHDESWYGIDAPLAGAVLIELADAGAIAVEDGRVVARPGATLPRAHHRAAVELVAGDAKRRTLRDWVDRLPGRLELQEQVGLSLVEQGILADNRSRFLGVTVKRFPERDPGPERELRARLAAALTGADQDPEPRLRILGGLLQAVDLVKKIVDKPDGRAAQKRAKRWLEEVPVGGAVSETVAAAQQAVMMTVITTTVISTGGSS